MLKSLLELAASPAGSLALVVWLLIVFVLVVCVVEPRREPREDEPPVPRTLRRQLILLGLTFSCWLASSLFLAPAMVELIDDEHGLLAAPGAHR
jgi:hypothetical protein